MNDAEGIRETFERTGVAAVMLARGCLGNPWLFEELTGGREAAPTPEEVAVEFEWVIDRAVEHLGAPRAARYLRKFYPWYTHRLGLDRSEQARLAESLQASETIAEAKALTAAAGGRTVEALADVAVLAA
jgi:tRNA-dihydrouridine synthase B